MSRRRGLTLIEVVAGLALLGGMLSGILMAYGRHVVQVRHAELRLRAAAAADRLLADWFGAPESGLRRHGAGRVPGAKRLRWRTRLLENAQVQGVTGIQVVRLEIFEESKAAGEAKGDPLVSVDLAVPDGEDPPEKDDTEDAKKQKAPR